MTIQTEIVRYGADGLDMISHFYVDDAIAGPRPGVLVFPEAFGLGEHAKGQAERLAKLGFAALACDLHGDGRVYDALDQIMPLIQVMRDAPARARARAEAALAALTSRAEVDAARIASIGYCFGGTLSLELARGGAAIAGVAGFHCGLGTVEPGAARISGKVLVCLGADDPGIPPEQRLTFEEEMRAGKVDWRMHLYGGVVHSFTNPAADALGLPDFARYDAGADTRSWNEMIALFDDIFA